MADGVRKSARRRLVDFIRMFNDQEMTVGRAEFYVQTGRLDIPDETEGVPVATTDTELPPEAAIALKKAGWT